MRFYGTFVRTLLPVALQPTRSRFIGTAQQIGQRQYWPCAAWQALQMDCLRALLHHAYERVPMYREAFDDDGVHPQELDSLAGLQRFPILTKAAVRANFPDRMAADGQGDGSWRYVGSGGTTNRVMVAHDFARRDIGLATDLVTYTEDTRFRIGDRQVSIPPDECSVHCGVEKRQQVSILGRIRTAGWAKCLAPETLTDIRGIIMDHWIRRATVLPPLYTTNPEALPANCRTAIAAIHALRPSMVSALPEYLRDLADEVHRSGTKLPPFDVVRPMGSNLPASWKENIETAFRCQIREHYGARETGGMAFDCRCCHGMHILADQFVVEVQCDGRPAAPGELGTILVTDLSNWATPLIRYRIGDLGRLDYEPCPCGRTTPRLRLEGREDDAIRTQDRLVSSEAVANVLYERHRIDRFQLIESSHGALALKLAPMPEMRNPEGVDGTLQELFGDERRLKIRHVSQIAPEASGKFRHCKANSQQRAQSIAEEIEVA